MNSFWQGIFLQATPTIPVQNILRSYSQQNADINRLNYYFFWAAGFILLSVVVLTVLVVSKYRHSKRENAPLKEASRKWEWATIGIPTVLVVLFLVMSIRTMRRVSPPEGNSQPEVIITGHQWWWEARYPSSGAVAANEIHLPAGRKILVKLLSDDVIHDWWVPELGNKRDLVPAHDNYLWLTINKPGTYYGICSEFCGAQHANMRIMVVAERPQDYTAWLQANQGASASVATQEAGEQLFMSKTCGNCHHIGGTPAIGTTGPDLTHMGSRHTLLAGMLVNNPDNLESWIRDPQKLKPGANMPKFILSDTAVKAISAYLQTLK